MDNGPPLVVTLSQPEYDIYSCEDLALELQKTYARQTVVVDMSGVKYLDSTCLGKLARMRSERAARGYAPAHLVVAAENIKRLFRIVHFEELWPIYDTLEEALEGSIRSGGVAEGRPYLSRLAGDFARGGIGRAACDLCRDARILLGTTPRG